MKYAKRLLPLVLFLAIVAASAWLYIRSVTQPGYYGLPVVACIDPTEPILQNFSFNLQITMAGKNVPLSPAIGHDPGDCLRVIHTDDASGKVFVQSNFATKIYTLGEFFNVWHKVLTPGGQKVQVYVNGSLVTTAENTPLTASTTISVIYQ
jgi:hypothetical protein